jgi:hypothetical protein
MPEQTNVTRRELLSGTAAGSLALATLGAVRPNEADAHTSGRAPLKPNILFILADDLGYADLSCYGRRDLSTPREALQKPAASDRDIICTGTDWCAWVWG